MAEAVVFYVLQKIGAALGEEALKFISSRFGKEASALLEIKGSMTHLKTEFTIMKAFLAEQQTHSSQDTTYDVWLDQVKKVACNAEDVIDEYAYLTEQTPKKGCKFKRLLCQSTNLDEWRDIAKQLKQIEVCLKNLMTARDRYGISVSEQGGGSMKGSLGQESYQELWSDSTYFDTEEDIVGKKKESAQLRQLLMYGPETRNVISIYGMGGIGKTTLARGIYKNNEINNKFDCLAWITVSQNYKVEDLLRRILRQPMEKKEKIPDQIDTMDRLSLVESLKHYLQDKKYLVVLDDMWGQKAWTLLDRALVENGKGSRVLITTRIEDVALIANNGYCIVPKHLLWEEAWDLFCQKAFQRLDRKRCPEVLIHWAKKIVKRCEGLPLAIVAIGSLLSYEKIDDKEWKKFYSQLSWHITNNQKLNYVTSILSLSFNCLPGNLKNCFMYCSLFPEDYVIRRKRIIRLWIAEGFVEERGEGITMEEVAEEYLEELVRRSLLQVVGRNLSGRPKEFQMHDLVREITVAKCKSEKFSLLVDNPHVTKLGDEARRVSVLKGAETVETVVGAKLIRSFILFDQEVTSAWIQNVFANFRLLTVLSLRGANIEKLPDIITDLFNLNYLDLRHSKVKDIPKSIGRLRKLQILDLLHTPVVELPGEIRMLTKLRLLRIGGFCDSVGVNRAFVKFRAVRICSQIYHLNDLQVLGHIEASEDVVSNLGKLTRLRDFAIHIVKQEYMEKLCTSIRSMPNLVWLAIILCVEDHVLNLQYLDHVPSLEWLRLCGKLHGGVVPAIFCSFSKLRSLFLEWSRLQVNPLPSISHMSNLTQLYLEKTYDGQLLTFRAGWFPKLQELYLLDMEHLSCIEMEAGTMPILNYVKLTGLRSMLVVPSGFQHVTSLQKLVLQDMPEEFIQRALGEDFVYIQHIPSILKLGR